MRGTGLNGIVQCKYFSRGVVGSPELQKFLGTIHHTRSHKGFFVTTRTFTLAADKFASEHPIELIDGPRLVELVQEAMGPGAQEGARAGLVLTRGVVADPCRDFERIQGDSDSLRSRPGALESALGTGLAIAILDKVVSLPGFRGAVDGTDGRGHERVA